MRRAVIAAVVVVLLVVAAVALFAGSETRLASGTTIAGIDVGGLDRDAAAALLERRSHAVEHAPVTFVAAGREFRFTASQLGVRSDWAGAVAEASGATNGVGPVRGVRRIRSRLFGVDVQPKTSAYPSAIRVAVGRIAHAVDRPAVAAGLRHTGLHIAVVPERAGAKLDRAAASTAIVASLASLERGGPVSLPTLRVAPTTTTAELAEAQRAFLVATSAPVTLRVAGRPAEVLSRARIAELVQLPSGGATGLSLSGRATDRLLASVAKDVNRKPADATFEVVSGGIRVRSGAARPGARRRCLAACDRARGPLRDRSRGHPDGRNRRA